MVTHPALIWFFVALLALAGLVFLTLGVIVARNLLGRKGSQPESEDSDSN